MATRRNRVRAAVLSIAILGACGDGDEREGTQPAPGVTTFEQGRFDDLPLLPDSDPFGPRSEQAGIVARSFRTTGVTPGGVIDFYQGELTAAGWELAEPVFRDDTASRADWVTDDWRLEISATRIQDRQNPSSTDVAVQYSLVLRPR
jgi:hypothetical protein